ncbi:MAG: hypothetical protein WAO08_21630 [Hyphomicrobiaceae bacterium]
MDGELCRGRVMHVWELETVPALQYVIRLDDPDFIHLELRDALMSSERAGALRLVASNSLAKPTPNFGQRSSMGKGELKFTLVGARRLQGAWVLVRLRHDRERGNTRIELLEQPARLRRHRHALGPRFWATLESAAHQLAADQAP